MSHTHPDHRSTIVMRPARGSDAPALARLAELDSKRAPRGDILVAEVDGVIAAALQLDGHVGIASPFRPSADLLALLELRAARDSEPPRGRRHLTQRLALRAAPYSRAA
ncbi:MAG TPA: hypothetical protein VES79_09685 [Solirubrobacteraceae bacterium]|nr:hypothetical protein [Solirubrobacteraceae bacterium]